MGLYPVPIALAVPACNKPRQGMTRLAIRTAGGAVNRRTTSGTTYKAILRKLSVEVGIRFVNYVQLEH